jgi:hypothetical protein
MAVIGNSRDKHFDKDNTKRNIIVNSFRAKIYFMKTKGNA